MKRRTGLTFLALVWMVPSCRGEEPPPGEAFQQKADSRSGVQPSEPPAAKPQATALGDGLVMGVNLDALVRTTLGDGVALGRRVPGARGVACDLLKDGEYFGRIELGVFQGREVAMEKFTGHMFNVSAGPDKDLSGVVGDKAVAYLGMNVGEKVADYRQQRSCLFVRDNVVVFLSLRVRWGDPVERSKMIDQALVKGKAGVERGKTVDIPRILKVDLPAEVVSGLVTPIKVLVAVSRHTKGMLGFAEASGVGVADKGDVHKLEAKETTEASAPGENVEAYAGRYLAPSPAEIRREARPLRVFWVCYATDRCVIATQKVTVTILPRREATENLVPPQGPQP